jgi:hypothetical protein
MNIFMRLTCALSAVVALLLGVAFSCHGPDGLGLGGVPDSLDRIGENRKLDEEIGERQRRVLARMRAKDAIAEDLIAGRLTLVEAAARVRDLPDGFDGWLGLLPPDEQGAGDGETLCRHVIAWARVVLADRPDKAAAVGRRLEAELAAHLKRHGTVTLP